MGLMSVSAELRRELLGLPREEREALADELYASLDDGAVDPEWESAWSKEIESRIADVDANRSELVDAKEMFRELHDEIRKPR